MKVLEARDVRLFANGRELLCELPLESELLDDGPSATWTPVPGRVYSWPSGRKTGPGARFVPDGKGGGTLHFSTPVVRKGFRPVTSIQKRARIK